jgi:hypothetical protein
MTWLNEGGAREQMLRFFSGARPGRANKPQKCNEYPRIAPGLMAPQAPLRADCARCQALCCVSLPFDEGESFGFDKPANAVCRHLGQDFCCRIHRELSARGQAGCAVYDCFGAGQRITQELFAGVSWQREPALRAAMFEAFRRLKRVHELRLLLHEAGRLPLSPPRINERARFLALLEPTPGLSREGLAALALPELETAIHAWLRGLSHELTPERARRSLPLLTR